MKDAPSADSSASTGPEACPICGNATVLLYERMYDDRYGYPGFYSVHRCNRCGHMHLPARFADHELAELYTKYYPRASYTTAQHRVPNEARGIRAWLRGEKCSAFHWVPKGVRVLDIGCGYCESLAYHKARGCEVYGVEADANARTIAGNFGYNVHIGLFDPSLYEPEYFDFVTLDQVIEHVTNPRDFLAGVARVLKPGGTVIISTPNPSGLSRRVFGRRWIHWHIPYHLQHFTRDSVAILARHAGLYLHRIRTLTHSEWFYFQLMHLIEVPACGTRHPFWSGKPWSTRKARAWAWTNSVARRMRLHHLINRSMDLLGIGDNQLLTLRKPGRQTPR
jgi:2-polyprenyl-3-methyl-5-hydroxy-6-metoxy-1,4-benzoquinol methylase